MRTLATIQTIKALEPIKGKDRILYASFESTNYRVIVASTSKVGDKVVYFECDSLLPVVPEFEFLRSRCFSEKKGGFRIRNMKMGGLYSEGLSIPVASFPKLASLADNTDVTESLGIQHVDEVEVGGKIKEKTLKQRILSILNRYALGRVLVRVVDFLTKDRFDTSWPKWASKTDETRAQSLTYIFDQYQGQEWYMTEKMDGSSMTVAIRKGKVTVCSRNQIRKKPKKLSDCNFWRFVIENDIERKMIELRKEVGHDFYMQGELCGAKIQGNAYKFTELKWFVFNVYDLDGGDYLDLSSLRHVCKFAGIDTVPMLAKFEWRFKSMDELLKIADGYSVFGSQSNQVLREGIVLRPVEPAPPDRGQSNMRSLKVISPSFELSKKD